MLIHPFGTKCYFLIYDLLFYFALNCFTKHRNIFSSTRSAPLRSLKASCSFNASNREPMLKFEGTLCIDINAFVLQKLTICKTIAAWQHSDQIILQNVSPNKTCDFLFCSLNFYKLYFPWGSFVLLFSMHPFYTTQSSLGKWNIFLPVRISESPWVLIPLGSLPFVLTSLLPLFYLYTFQSWDTNS